MRKLENAVGCCVLQPSCQLGTAHLPLTASDGNRLQPLPDSCRGANPSWPRSNIRRDTSNHRSATDFLSLPQAKQWQGTELSESTCYLSSPGLAHGPQLPLQPLIAGLGSPRMPEAVVDLLVHNPRQSTLTGSALALHGGPDVDVHTVVPLLLLVGR